MSGFQHWLHIEHVPDLALFSIEQTRAAFWLLRLYWSRWSSQEAAIISQLRNATRVVLLRLRQDLNHAFSTTPSLLVFRGISPVICSSVEYHIIPDLALHPRILGSFRSDSLLSAVNLINCFRVTRYQPASTFSLNSWRGLSSRALFSAVVHFLTSSTWSWISIASYTLFSIDTRFSFIACTNILARIWWQTWGAHGIYIPTY